MVQSDPNLALAIWAPVVGAVILVALLGALWLLFVAARLRRTLRVPAQPTVQQTSVEDLPQSFRPRLTEFIRELGELGFAIVANVTMPRDVPGRQDIQCLFVNRVKQERAGVFCMVRSAKYLPFIAFVTEFGDGTEIKTDDAPGGRSGEQSTGSRKMASMPWKTPTRMIYEEHERRVAAFGPRDVPRVMPPEGDEIDYIFRRHVAARASSLPRRGYVLDETGETYRPTWRAALRLAAHRVCPCRFFFRWDRNSPVEKSSSG